MSQDTYTADKFLSLLAQLSRKLSTIDEHIDLLLFGGGAMALYYGARDKTQDLDAVVRGASLHLVNDLIVDVAYEQGARKDWLNNQGAHYITQEILDSALDFITLPGIQVKVACPEAMLALKISSMRSDLETPDEADVKFLLKKLNVKDEQAALNILEAYLPGRGKTLTKYHLIRLQELIDEANILPE